MLKKRTIWLNVAAALMLLSAGAVSAQSDKSQLTAISGLSGNYVFDTLADLPAPADVSVPAAQPVPMQIPAAERSSSGAPAPGTSLTPVIQDQNRAEKIMELIAKIHNGDSLPYSHDGIVFTNKEGVLPQASKGYYHEYTLVIGDGASSVVIGDTTYPVAPALSARGAERIIIGGGQLIYYTPDHYRHFIQLQIVY